MTLSSHQRSLGALVITTVTTSMTDNMLKTFVLLHLISQGRWVGALATLSFVVPYLIFSPLAGNLGDHFPRDQLLRLYKYSELAAVILSCIGILTGLIPLMMSALIIFGLQITFISPVKLGLLPDLVTKERLVAANGLLDGTTFIAILIGTALASLLSPVWLCVIMLGSTAFGLGASVLITSSSQGGKPINIRWFSSLRFMMHTTYRAGKINVALLLSLFWGVASALLPLIPSFMHQLSQKAALPMTEAHAASLLILITTLTLGLGALCAGFAPTSKRLATCFFIAMLLAALGFFYNVSWTTDLVLLSVGGLMAGLCSSQFYAFLLQDTHNDTSTISAGNNILNAIAMSIASLLLMMI